MRWKILKRSISLCLLVLLASPARSAQAWNEADHQEMTRRALAEVVGPWRLDRPCEVRPLASLLKKLGTLREGLGDAWHLSDYLRINTKIELDREDRSFRDRKTLTPLEILATYSIDPDDGRDQDLFVRNEKGVARFAFPDQKWFGSIEGSNSQAFRHIEKPPFRWRDWQNTFGLPFRSVGEASLRTEIYFQASLLAFNLGEEYWGWRLLANALHYVEDLHNPYHAGQITPRLVFRGLTGYLSWGRKELGLMGTFAHLVANSHRFYEGLVASSFDEAEKASIVSSVEGSDLLTIPFDSDLPALQALARNVRDESNRSFSRLVSAVTAAHDPILIGPYDFESDKEAQDDPRRLIQKGPGTEVALQSIVTITRDRFQSAGRAIRTVVHESIVERSGARVQNPYERLEKLDSVL